MASLATASAFEEATNHAKTLSPTNAQMAELYGEYLLLYRRLEKRFPSKGRRGRLSCLRTPTQPREAKDASAPASSSSR